MKKKLLFFNLLILAVMFNAKSQVDFEGMLHNYQNGVTLNEGFHSNNYNFVNYYNSNYGSWSGFAYSKQTDGTTSGYSNQYSAITAEGYNSSKNYIVANVSTYNAGTYIKLDTATGINGFYVTNSTYTHNSMRDGDTFAKKFGTDTSATGVIDGTNGKDWFLLTIKGYNNGSFTDSVNFYLADFRFDNDDDDYIINDWTFVDLTSLSNVDSIKFELSSSDNNPTYGMNTPAYFCLDYIKDENNIATDFEELQFDYYNGNDLAGGFTSGNAYFFNTYNSVYSSWSGFAYSRVTDNTTSGYANQYSAITGSGYDNSETYAVSYGTSAIKFDSIYIVNSIFATNSTYAHNSMRDGDAFAKKFGTDTNSTGVIDGTNGEDWFLLTIKGYKNGNYIDSVNFYLADFRFDNDDDDYIINNWTEVDLTSLGGIDSLNFSLSSSDNNTNYNMMNTPAYFCLDHITTTLATEIAYTKTNIENITVYPNPVKNIINIKNAQNSQITINNLSGKIVYKNYSYNNIEKIDLSFLNNGMYIISIKTDTSVITRKIIKK